MGVMDPFKFHELHPVAYLIIGDYTMWFSFP